MKLIYLKSALKCDSFDVAIDVKIHFFRVLVTIEPGRSLLQFVTTICLITFIVLSYLSQTSQPLCLKNLIIMIFLIDIFMNIFINM